MSITEEIYLRLRKDIVLGKIPGGRKLLESVLSEKIGVSRTPVRVALQKLTSEGLISFIPRAGYFVNQMSEEEVRDMFETRTSIEHVASQRALTMITSKELELLELNVRKTDEVLRGDSSEKMMNLDMQFHDIIYRACRSKTLYEICQKLSENTLKFRIACIHIPIIAKRARDGHFEIYEALKSRNPGRLQVAISSHFENTIEDILGYLHQVIHNSPPLAHYMN